MKRARKKIPGLAVKVTENYLRAKNNEKERLSKQSEDCIRRKYVVETIVNSISKGKSEEETLQILMNDPIVDYFKYLDDIEKYFKNLISSNNIKQKIEKERMKLKNNNEELEI